MPDIHKRHLLKAAAWTAASGATGIKAASAAPVPVVAAAERGGHARAAFVLVHGGWHGAWCYERVVPLLAAQGHAAIACDLPGHGLGARFPLSYGVPGQGAAFLSERSPLAGIGIDDYAERVIAAIDALWAGGHRRIVVVGHSMGGIALNAAGERAAGKIDALVYLAANMPASDVPVGVYFGLPEAAGARVNPVLLGDPSATGAFRIDPLSTDPAYRAALRLAFYNDASDADFEAAAHLLTPDMPFGPMVTPIALSARRWGAIERHYIVCLRDNAVPQPLARRFIADADALVPGNRTRVHELDTGHSPFVTAPQELARLLAGIAARAGA